MYARCPQCLSDEMYWSRSGNRWLPRPVRLFVVPGRCHLCGRRSLFRGRLLLGPQLRQRAYGAGERATLAGKTGGGAAAGQHPPRRWGSYVTFFLLPLVGLAAGGLTWYWAAAREARSSLQPVPRSHAPAPVSVPQPAPLSVARVDGATPVDPVEQLTQREEQTVAPPAADGPGAEEFRIWRDAERKRQVRAKLLSTDGQEVLLLREDGRVFPVPLEPLSDEDRQYVRARTVAKRVPPLHSP